MERLMLAQLQVRGCAAEAWLNGMPIASCAPGQPACNLPVHEYALAGANRLELVVAPGHASDAVASLALLLPRIGAPADDTQVRSLARLDWTAPPTDAPADPEAEAARRRTELEVALPINFPRWRWLDAPVIEPDAAIKRQIHAFVAGLAQDLTRGQTAGYLAATRLRNEEIALAYQRDPQQESARLRSRLEQRYASRHLQWPPLPLEALQLRRLAEGRLLECLDAEGRPALRSEPDDEGQTLVLPLRLAMVEGKIYVLR